jgi:hypothetical protein
MTTVNYGTGFADRTLVAGTTAINSGAWHSFVLCVAINSIEWWINATPQAITLLNGTPTALKPTCIAGTLDSLQNARIGQRPASSNYPWHGSLAKLGCVRRQVSQADVTAFHDKTKAYFGVA